MGKRISFEPGQTIEVPNYPFVRFVFHGCDIDGPFSDDGWRPGCEKSVEEGLVYYAADEIGRASCRERV